MDLQGFESRHPELKKIIGWFSSEHINAAATVASKIEAFATDIVAFIPDGPILLEGLALLQQVQARFLAAVDAAEGAKDVGATIPAPVLDKPVEGTEDVPQASTLPGTVPASSGLQDPAEARDVDDVPVMPAPAAPAVLSPFGIPGRDHPITWNPETGEDNNVPVDTNPVMQ